MSRLLFAVALALLPALSACVTAPEEATVCDDSNGADCGETANVVLDNGQ